MRRHFSSMNENFKSPPKTGSVEYKVCIKELATETPSSITKQPYRARRSEKKNRISLELLTRCIVDKIEYQPATLCSRVPISSRDFFFFLFSRQQVVMGELPAEDLR